MRQSFIRKRVYCSKLINISSFLKFNNFNYDTIIEAIAGFCQYSRPHQAREIDSPRQSQLKYHANSYS